MSAAGYKVHMVASGKVGENTGIVFHPLDEASSRFRRIFFKQNQAYEIVQEIKPFILHIHDPELLFLGLRLKRTLKCRLIFDIHEYYRDQIKIKKWIRTGMLRTVTAYMYAVIEKLILKKYDGLVVAVPGLLPVYSFHPNVCLVRNSPILKTIKESDRLDSGEERKVIIYPGTLSASRGIINMVKALEYLDFPVILWLMGSWQSKREREEAENLPGWEKVRYWGKVAPEMVYSAMKRANAGVQLLQPEGQYEKDAIDVKVLEYFTAEVPVIVSDMKNKRSFFKEAAYYVDSTDPKSIAAGITRVLNDPVLREKCISQGKEFIKDYSWEKEEKNLLDFYVSMNANTGNIRG